jgi:hypothetical protein
VNCPYTTAAFTLPPDPSGFVMSCPLTLRQNPGTHLWVMQFLPVGSHVLAPASSRPFLTESPLPSARTSGSIQHMDTLGSRTGDYLPVRCTQTGSPISSRPCRAYTTGSSGRRIAAVKPERYHLSTVNPHPSASSDLTALVGTEWTDNNVIMVYFKIA